MTVRKNLDFTNTFYYCTVTCYKWLPLFQLTDLHDYIYGWFNMLHKKRRIKICAYVIMPNHLHFVFFVSDISGNINKIISNGKRFMAYEIVKRLKVGGNEHILRILEQGVSDKDRRRKKIHQVFQLSFDLKVLNTDKFIEQKINYIHANTISKKWNLVDDYKKYKHSSAGFYEEDVEYCGYPVTHYMKVLD